MERLTLRDDDGRALLTPYGLKIYCSTQATADCICKLEEALQAQEPRVMTLYEVAKMAADFQDCMLWFEPKELDDDMWFMAYAQPVESDETDIHIYEFGNDVPIEAKKYLYGKTWRCWTSRPDEKMRAETPWE